MGCNTMKKLKLFFIFNICFLSIYAVNCEKITISPHKVADEDGTALCDGEGKDEGEHHNVGHITSRGQCLVADDVDEIGDDYLREAVRHVLAGRGDAYLQQIFQLHPRERGEQFLREGGYMLLEQDDKQDDDGDEPAEGGGDGRTLHTKSGHAELTEDKGIVADDVEHVHHHGHVHGVLGLVGTSERGRK